MEKGLVEGFVFFFSTVTQVAFRRQKLQNEQNPRGYPENPVGWDGAQQPLDLCCERLQREMCNFQVNNNSRFRQAENLQGRAALSLQLQYLCDIINGFQYTSGDRYSSKRQWDKPFQ